MKTKLYLPYEGRVKLSSPYGYRTLNGEYQFHAGIDLIGLDSKTILCPMEGTVKTSTIITNKDNLTWEWGNYIRIDSGLFSVYLCHLERSLVNEGDVLKLGQPIGIEGETGYAFGRHCHYELRINNVKTDPCPFIGIQNKAGIYENEKDCFRDNKPDSWAEEAVNWAIQNNIIRGDSDLNPDYKLHDNVTRQDAIVFLYRLYNILL